MEKTSEFQPHVSLHASFFQVLFKNVTGVKPSANTISNKLNTFLKENENCKIVSVCCTANRCGEKTFIDGRVAGERREPKSTAGASEREEAGEREAT